MVNAEQQEAWDGDEGAHWVEHQARYEELTAAFTEPLFEAARLQDTDHVLDVGCGCGQTTRLAAARVVQGEALGVDLSAAMLERGRADAAAEDVRNVRFEQADAQVHPLARQTFDVAISRFGVMFFDNPVAAFANIASSVVPGGRLVFLCWRDFARNEFIAVPAGAALTHVPFPDLDDPNSPGPFSLADTARIAEVLTAAGFVDIETVEVKAPMRFGDDADEAVSFLAGMGMARALLEPVDLDTRTRALHAVRDALRGYERPDGVFLEGVAWLVTAARSDSIDSDEFASAASTPTGRRYQGGQR